jgi:hypothetical protein
MTTTVSPAESLHPPQPFSFVRASLLRTLCDYETWPNLLGTSHIGTSRKLRTCGNALDEEVSYGVIDNIVLRRFAPAVGYVNVDSLTAQQLFCAFSACPHRDVDGSVREACGGTTAA